MDYAGSVKTRKPTFENQKAVFEAMVIKLEYTKKTKTKILRLYSEYGQTKDFGRREIAKIFNVSFFSAGELIRKMKKANLIEGVSGHGKGRYKFLI